MSNLKDSYRPYYWRFFSLYEGPGFESKEECLSFLQYGILDDGEGYPEKIMKNGEVVMDQDTIMETLRGKEW